VAQNDNSSGDERACRQPLSSARHLQAVCCCRSMADIKGRRHRCSATVNNGQRTVGNVWAHPGRVNRDLYQFGLHSPGLPTGSAPGGHYPHALRTALGAICENCRVHICSGVASRRPSQTARVKPRAMLSRRSLITTAIGGGAAWLIGGVSFLASYCGRAGSMSASSTFADFWADLGYSRTIGEACLKALPAVEATKGCLSRAVFGDTRDGGGDCLSAQAIRERSRDDFRDGRIVTVEGWMLSLTETRVYALAALLASPGETVE
jgi:hypothetical protein